MERTGIAAAPGIAIGRAIVKKEENMEIVRRSLEPNQISLEVERFKDCVQQAILELAELKEITEKKVGEEEAKIFEAQQLFLQDPEFVGAIENMIEAEHINAEAATQSVRDQFLAIFESMENEYMRERSADLRDVSQRILRHLLSITQNETAVVDGPQILVVHDLTPSDTAKLDLSITRGFATDIGGRTSHSAIMARTMGIPAVVGLSNVTEEVSDGDLIIVDGSTGNIHIRPEPVVLQEYEDKLRDFQLRQETLAKLIHQSTMTRDGRHVELAANIGNPSDAESAISHGAEAIGLFRTEFLYMGRDDFPSEEEQFASYKSVLETMGNKPVIIRTLDIGGDKELPYLNLPEELNPFLGYRAIRLCLDQTELFKTQLRALLRSSAYGNLRIMYPMIATLDELRKANQVLSEVKQELVDKNISFNHEVQVGIMIEVPAAALVADQLAKHVDFFSIGTNDLIQYTMAADRMNPQVSYLYDPFNPSLLRLIQMVIIAAHREGKWVGMCGEMAGEKLAIPILLGLGLDEFSMGASSILQARHLIKQLDSQKMAKIAEHVLTLSSGQEIKDYIQQEVMR
ncbi:phosphoenolpyruvate--protein phosphotransferase [Ammoniphilus resinae]|uniref:Phosphoenolpyruvate-protein phosphotransferase n=1 Tax=Ammoniphilus resinae TaxID=861532 RepID=A0ABS4GWS7_9BACL|nr:phosphoenolpyruvate--protein phosphotransferase [Ammoniphilus resinae]MBP1934730.1 phosphotransferase system enzyme I (PtsI) [Ammoniphilus resinae]